MCPDAYSYAFDDQSSTFIIPSGAGFEVVFCPRGRSTTILRRFGEELTLLGQMGMKSEFLDVARGGGESQYIEPKEKQGGTVKREKRWWGMWLS